MTITNLSPNTNNGDQEKSSDRLLVVDGKKQSAIRNHLVILSLILMISGGFSIEIQTSELYTKVKIVKQQSPLAEAIDLLGNWLH